MEFNAIFEIRYDLGYIDEKTQSKTRYECPRFFAHNPASAIRAAYNMARAYTSENPKSRFIDDTCVKIIQITGPSGRIDQKSTGISGYFEGDCLTVRYSGLENFFELSKN